MAAGTASETEPVGSGPFEFADYSPGDSFRMTRNENYWLIAPDGEPYPYLDEIEFLVQAENQTRDNAIISGDIDITHMDSGDSIERLRQEADAGTINLFEIDQRQETGYVLINVGDPNTAASDVRVRQAMAYAFDHVVENQSRNAGIFEIANGPFSPGSIGYLEDTGFPEFDLDAGHGADRRVRVRHRSGGGDRLQDDDRPVQPADRRALPRLLGGGGHDRQPRPDRAGRVHHARPSSATSRPSAGATTAASTPTPRRSGGRARTPRPSARSG